VVGCRALDLVETVLHGLIGLALDALLDFLLELLSEVAELRLSGIWAPTA
jgi:hypothetical protein